MPQSLLQKLWSAAEDAEEVGGRENKMSGLLRSFDELRRRASGAPQVDQNPRIMRRR